VNVRERGDNTYPMHWAAAAAHLDVVRLLADAGGDVVGRGDDHELEVIGWATCWHEADTDAHRAVAEFLVSRGARHHIFSAIAMNLATEVRRIVAERPAALNARMSRNEGHQTPLHFAVRMKRPAMVALLLELGADPLAVDGAGHTAASYADTPDIDRPIMAAIRAMTAAELVSADRGLRRPRAQMLDLAALVSLGDWDGAERLVRDQPELVKTGGPLHLMAKRNDRRAVEWLLGHGADPNAMWSHWGAEATALHLAAMEGHAEVARVLLAAGADPSIRDSQHNADVLEWAEFFGKVEIVGLLKDRTRA
jgi:ankyrin repeat protein